MPRMTQQEVETFLAEPRVAHLVTLRPDGRPHVAPVWFQWAAGRAVVMTGAASVKARNVEGDSAVVLSIASDQQPYCYVTLEGEARISRDDLADIVRGICVRYYGPERGLVSAQELLASRDMVLVHIQVHRLVSRKFDQV